MTSKERVLDRERQRGKANALDLVKRLPNMTDTEIIDEEDNVPDWDENKDYTSYDRGFAVGFEMEGERNIFGLLQPHNAMYYPGTNPNNNRSLWSLKHTKNPLKARAFVPAQGVSGLYMKDECYRDGETVYICEAEQTNYTYAEYPAHWRIWDGE